MSRNNGFMVNLLPISRLGFWRFLALGLLISFTFEAWAFKTPLEVPAIPSRLAVTSPFQGVALAGNRLVAVGARGHIVVSDDMGKNWRQVSVPVSCDLTAVFFPSPKLGWAVGQWGVVLHTTDGGETWVKQWDGKQATEIALRYYEAQQGAAAESTLLKLKSQVKWNVSRSLLDVYFENDNVGYVVGTFNRIFRTEDGGKTWTPLIDRIENPTEFHLYSIRGMDGRIFITGEKGMVWQFDPKTLRSVARQTPYGGTLFGVVIDRPPYVAAFGMRGSVLYSADDGKTWKKLSLTDSSGAELEAGISAGTLMPDGRMILVSQVGDVLISDDHANSFRDLKLPTATPYYGLAAISDKTIALVGPKGPRVESLP